MNAELLAWADQVLAGTGLDATTAIAVAGSMPPEGHAEHVAAAALRDGWAICEVGATS